MRRILVDPKIARAPRIVIDDPNTVHHVSRVLRMQVGDALECLDGQGGRYQGAITALSDTAISVSIEWHSKDNDPAVRGITLVQALIKPTRFDWIVEKAAELGAERLVPVITERSVIQLSREQTHKHQRWQRIADQALEQCGRATRMRVEPARSLADWLRDCAKTPATILIPTLEGDRVALAEAARSVQAGLPVAILIGPEGDFSPAELEAAKKQGAIPVSLGTLTLRSETAAVALIAILQHLRLPAHS